MVNYGDVVHADMNGVVVFPLDLVDFVIEESHKVTERESANIEWVNRESINHQDMKDHRP